MITIPQHTAEEKELMNAVDVHITHGGGMGGSSYHRISVEPLMKNDEGFYILTFLNGETLHVNPSYVASIRDIKLFVYKKVPCGTPQNRYYKTLAYKFGEKEEHKFGKSDMKSLTESELGLEV